MRCVEDPHDELHFLRLHLLAYKEHQMEWNIMRNYICFYIENSFERCARHRDVININHKLRTRKIITVDICIRM